MIQPINAQVSRADLRGQTLVCGKTSKAFSKSDVALINAGGVASAAGGIGTLLARRQTASWSQAGFFGACAAVLTLFFITPSIIATSSSSKKIPQSDSISKKKESNFKEDAKIIFDVIKEHFEPVKKVP